MHLVHIPVNTFDQIVADCGIDVVLCDGGGEGRGIFPGLRVEDLLLHLPVIEHGPGVFELTVSPVKCFERILPKRPVPGHLDRNKAAVRKLDLFSLPVTD